MTKIYDYEDDNMSRDSLIDNRLDINSLVQLVKAVIVKRNTKGNMIDGIDHSRHRSLQRV